MVDLGLDFVFALELGVDFFLGLEADFFIGFGEKEDTDGLVNRLSSRYLDIFS